MRVLIVGVPCVGKSTVGALLAKKWGYNFVDFDFYVEEQMGDSIERIKNTCFNEHSYRNKVKPLFVKMMEENPENTIIAMPPSGLRQQYKFILDKYHSDVITVTLKDKAKNILKRLVFYDEDANLIEEEVVNEKNEWRYYEDIKEDIEYYRATHSKAKIKFSMDGMNAEEAAEGLAKFLEQYIAEGKTEPVKEK